MRMALEALDRCMSSWIRAELDRGEEIPRNTDNPFVAKFKELGGFDRLEELQSDHRISPSVFSLCADLVHRFWFRDAERDYRLQCYYRYCYFII